MSVKCLAGVTVAIVGFLAGTSNTARAQPILPGANQLGNLVQSSDGTVYGATQHGNHAAGCDHISGCSTLFRIGSDGSAATVYSFSAADGLALGDVGIGPDGNIYGFSTRSDNDTWLFSYNPTASFSFLTDFSAAGYYPQAYGSLIGVGAGLVSTAYAPPARTGVFIRIATDGTFKPVKVAVPNGKNVSVYGAELTLTPSGSTYGWNGSFWSLSASGKAKFISDGLFTINGVVWSCFCGSSIFVNAQGHSFVAGSSSTTGGQIQYGILDVSPTGHAKVFVKFPQGVDAYGFAGAADGTLYANVEGGKYGGPGALISISTSKKITLLHEFQTVSSAPIECNPPNTSPTYTYSEDGRMPSGYLLAAQDGSIWGSTAGGVSLTPCDGNYPTAPNNGGTVFRYDPASKSFMTMVGFSY